MAKSLLLRTNDQRSLENLSSYIAYLNDQNKGKQTEYIVTIKQNKPIRSVSANAYYWVVLTAIASETGDTKEQLHYYYSLEFNGEDFRGKRIPKSTSDLDSAEFKIYVEKVKQHAKDFHNMYIPEPEDKAYAIWQQITHEKYNAMYSSL